MKISLIHLYRKSGKYLSTTVHRKAFSSKVETLGLPRELLARVAEIEWKIFGIVAHDGIKGIMYSLILQSLASDNIVRHLMDRRLSWAYDLLSDELLSCCCS